jgi:hypothetical protein
MLLFLGLLQQLDSALSLLVLTPLLVLFWLKGFRGKPFRKSVLILGLTLTNFYILLVLYPKVVYHVALFLHGYGLI